jgi:lipoyl(octanoyl) transferase
MSHALTPTTLQAYLLGLVDFDAALLLQRRLFYDVTGHRDRAAIIVCEHPPLITVGRHGSHSHLRLDDDNRGLQLRWVPRGGGCWLHLPGQFALYSVMPLDTLGLTIPEYLARLGSALVRVLNDFSVHHATRVTEVGVCVASRPVATLGACVRDQVTTFGSVFNLCPDLEDFRRVRCHPAAREPMTSLERERRGAVRPGMVRERIVEHVAAAFGIPHIAPFTDHVLLHRNPTTPQKATA